MIDRYARKEMQDIWTDKSKFDIYLEIEILNAEALNTFGIVSDEELTLIKKNAKYDLDTVYELERKHKHDVIAFTRAVSLLMWWILHMGFSIKEPMK